MMLTLLGAGAAVAAAVIALRFTGKPATPQHRASPAPHVDQGNTSASDGALRSGGKRERPAAFGRR